MVKLSNRKYASMYDLTGKNAIVTGGAGILGQHFCTGLAEFGANVAIVDMNLDKAAELAQTLSETYGVQAVAYRCDVSSPEEVKACMDQYDRDFGEVHILHNNAASKSSNLDEFFASFEDYSIDEWRKVMSVNIDGMFLMAQQVGKRMIAQGKGGSIIQTASIYGIMAPDKRIYEGSYYMDRQISSPAVYSASKASVVGLTKYLAAYWAEYGIRVNAITPGGVESGQNDTFKQKYSARIPMGRMARPEEMVGALIYLASDASSYVTGHNIVVDGGLNCW